MKVRCGLFMLVLTFVGFVLPIIVADVVGKKREKRETISDAIVPAIDRSWLRIEQL